MNGLILGVVGLHVLAGVFWAGTTLGLARTGVNSGAVARYFAPQVMAGVGAVVTGAYLWHTFHTGSAGIVERTLGIGSMSALVALLVQAIVGGLVTQQLRAQQISQERADRRLTVAYRGAAFLLAVTVVCMATASYMA